MIAEYVEDLRRRLNIAVRTGHLTEISRLSVILGAAMDDGARCGEQMPWDKACPICGSPIPPAPSEAGEPK